MQTSTRWNIIQTTIIPCHEGGPQKFKEVRNAHPLTWKELLTEMCNPKGIIATGGRIVNVELEEVAI